MQTKRKHRMKYGILLLFAGVCLLYGGYEPRADINGDESRVIGAAGSTFYYDGAYYRVKDTYLNQLINALDTQYDLSAGQANACIDYIYNNIGAAVTAGYVYRLPEEELQQSEPQMGGDADIAADSDTPAVITVEKETTVKTKEEVLKEATALASDMGVNIRFDSSEDGITITDQKGNVLISTREAVKNTGFRLNSLLVFLVGLFAAVCVMTAVAWKGKLLEQEDGDGNAGTCEENS